MANVQNLASGILAEDITASATTVLVNVGSGSATVIKAVWPTAPFYITVMPNSPVVGVANSLDSEVMLVTAVGNDQVGNVSLTVTRAQKNTSAKAFSAGAVVTNGIYTEDLGLSYSTDEVETAAKWVDGKTIYKKTISSSDGLTAGSYLAINHNISNLGVVVKHEGVFVSSAGSYPLPFGAPTSQQFGGNAAMIWLTTSTNTRIYSNYTLAGTAYVTLYYTKTS